MPSRSFFSPPDFAHVEAILRDADSSLADAEFVRFRQLGRAPLINELSLAHALSISPRFIMSIRKKKDKHYRCFIIPKANGDPREILAPRTFLKVLQWWILDNVVINYDNGNDSFGFIKGRNSLMNARYHSGAAHLLNVDIKDFFDSVKFKKVTQIFSEFGYSADIAMQLADVCTFNSSLPQGAPTSAALANIAAGEVDERLRQIAVVNGLRYSRYADDITFSSLGYIPASILHDVKQEVGRAGFMLNERKTRFLGPGDRQEVTGIVINEKIQPTRKWRKNTRALFFQALIRPKDFVDQVTAVEGKLSYARQILGCDHQLTVQGNWAVASIKREISVIKNSTSPIVR